MNCPDVSRPSGSYIWPMMIFCGKNPILCQALTTHQALNVPEKQLTNGREIPSATHFGCRMSIWAQRERKRKREWERKREREREKKGREKLPMDEKGKEKENMNFVPCHTVYNIIWHGSLEPLCDKEGAFPLIASPAVACVLSICQS